MFKNDPKYPEVPFWGQLNHSDLHSPRFSFFNGKGLVEDCIRYL